MEQTAKPFLALTAQDLMTSPVAAIPEEMPLQEAAHLLSREQISGAPVVNAAGRCVGVLTATDFLHWADHGCRAEGAPHSCCVHTDWEVVDVEPVGQEEVRYHMSADPITVPGETLVTEAAQRMLEAHIHRLIVVDAAGCPVGIVTSTDILRAVALQADRV